MSDAVRLFHDGRVRVIHGDSRDVLKTLADNSVDSVGCDPPYALVSIRERFGAEDAAPARGDVYARASSGFMGQQWDTGDTAFDPAFWREVLRVLKPGGYLAAFSHSRTYHRMACAIEDAGFDIRDLIADFVAADATAFEFCSTLNDAQRAAFFSILEDLGLGGMCAWLYGTGFPKSRNVAKDIDRTLGVTGTYGVHKGPAHAGRTGKVAGRAIPDRPWMHDEEAVDRNAREYLPASDQAKALRDHGTALKPAIEPICLARKPFASSVAANVLEHGTGALNIGACRIAAEKPTGWGGGGGYQAETWADGNYGLGKSGAARPVMGRWPANVIHDGSEDVVRGFPMEGGASAARFFYSAKADAKDRLGSAHPTVKPVDVMRWLLRLITPAGGVTLDPFAGSGTTGIAALAEGFGVILIEREPRFIADIHTRFEHARGAETHSASLMARNKTEPKEPLPLFGNGEAEKEK